MKKNTLHSVPIVIASICAAGGADNASRIGGDAAPPNPNRISLSYRLGYNIEAKFSGLGGSASRGTPGPAAGGVNHEYDDGYVRLDSTHNGLGLTWNWGFDSASQVNGDNLLMHSGRALGDSSRAGGDDLHHGFEITYAREMGLVKKARWGLEGAFNYMNIGIRDGGSRTADLELTTDTYALEGIIPFDPITSQTPYRGTFTGPGPLIPDAPIDRSVEIIPGGALLSGSRELDANLFGFRFGPYIEWPLSDRWTFGLNAGFALVVADSEFDFRETVTPANASSFTASGSKSEVDLLPGGYIGANIALKVADAVTVFGGAQFQHVGDLEHDVNGKRAELDLGQSVFVTVGINYSF